MLTRRSFSSRRESNRHWICVKVFFYINWMGDVCVVVNCGKGIHAELMRIMNKELHCCDSHRTNLSISFCSVFLKNSIMCFRGFCWQAARERHASVDNF
jgi:hypothetical protein